MSVIQTPYPFSKELAAASCGRPIPSHLEDEIEMIIADDTASPILRYGFSQWLYNTRRLTQQS